jgi:hypothetical protein
MTSPVPGQLLDTCAIINLSYCAPVASAFRSRYEGSAGWVRATQAELVRQRSRRPPHPQAGRASNWAAMWLGRPIEMVDENLLIATESVQRSIAAGYTDSALDHLGEAASIALLASVGKGRLISDDHAARAESRKRGVNASSTVGVVAHLLTIAGSGVDPTVADTYLQTLRARERMHAQLTSIDLLAGDLGPWL